MPCTADQQLRVSAARAERVIHPHNRKFLEPVAEVAFVPLPDIGTSATIMQPVPGTPKLAGEATRNSGPIRNPTTSVVEFQADAAVDRRPAVRIAPHQEACEA